MIVTVSIRQENTEEQRSVSASAPCIDTAMAIGIAVYDASGDAITEARKLGWLDDSEHVHKVAEAHLPMTGGNDV